MIDYLEDFYSIICKYEISIDDVCFVSSMCMAASGIRKNRDIEFVLKTSARNRLLSQLSNNLEINNYSGSIKLSNVVECVYRPYCVFGIEDDELFCDEFSYMHNSLFRVVKNEVVAAYKILINREKDEHDIAMFKKYGVWTKEFEIIVEQYIQKAQKRGWKLLTDDRDKAWLKIINSPRELAIFGTGYIGRNIYRRIRGDGREDKIKGFIVSHKTTNDFLFGHKIYAIDELDLSCVLVLLAVTPQNAIDNMKMLADVGADLIEYAFRYWK